MKATDFCYWLQGYFEIHGASANPGTTLTIEQVEIIKRHLALVFVHDIDPQTGPPEHQQVLNKIHSKGMPEDMVYRC